MNRHPSITNNFLNNIGGDSGYNANAGECSYHNNSNAYVKFTNADEMTILFAPISTASIQSVSHENPSYYFYEN